MGQRYKNHRNSYGQTREKNFDNKPFVKLLEKKKVHLYWTQNEEKSSVAEGWNHTIKSRMWKYFTKNCTGVYIDVLSSIIEKYNNTYHRSIKCTPSDARKPSNHQHVFNALYGGTNKSDEKLRKLPKFHVGDQVRITKRKSNLKRAIQLTGLRRCLLLLKYNPHIHIHTN